MNKVEFCRKHDSLSLYAANWLSKQCRYKIVLANIKCRTLNEQPDVFAINGYGVTVVIEVKSSRSDFLKDKNKKFRKPNKGMGDYRLYCCLPGVVKDLSEIPKGWGLIEVVGVTKPRMKLIHGVKPSGQYNLYNGKHVFNKDNRLLLIVLQKMIILMAR